MFNAAVTLPIWFVALFVITIAVLAIILWSVKRRRRPNLKQMSEADGTIVETPAGLVQSTPVGGNTIDLLQNGAFFDRLFADIEAAKSTINIETFLCKQGEVTRIRRQEVRACLGRFNQRTHRKIGSANFDDRSFEINDEISLVVWDEGMAGRLEAIFDEDLKLATERKLEEWPGVLSFTS